ncbi:cell surface protein SprA [Halosquirtibacter xylanolyticus]|uniref:T9SS outer membrane translocon Sov/SprA n=1 Tax=Halosquirtibacter xylanolyticus TaxID=3374599 RepID=UPI003748A5CC|nr:cell surface protein SprA [Prolixibacteraceae bacterium]
MILCLGIAINKTNVAFGRHHTSTHFERFNDAASSSVVEAMVAPYEAAPDSTELTLPLPDNMKTEEHYDPTTNQFVIEHKVGDLYYQPTRAFSLDDYVNYDFDRAIQQYWQEKTSKTMEEKKKSLIPSISIGGEAFTKIFGNNTISIKPQGYIELSFGTKTNRIDNPALSERLRKTTTFDFDEKINLSVKGSIGNRLSMGVNYNTEATFDFENRMNLNFKGEEDDIVKNIEAGNVSMSSDNSLIKGGVNLFGVKTDLQFGKLSVSTVLSQQKGESKVINTEGGATKTDFNIQVLDYEANKHFFLGQVFYDQYDQSLSKMPIISSSINITKLEVWITNKTGNYTQSRNIVAFTDLGERGRNKQNNTTLTTDAAGLPYPDNTYPWNGSNNLYDKMNNDYNAIRDIAQVTSTLGPLKQSDGFLPAQDYEKVENARMLTSSEYTFNQKLGYISLNRSLSPDEVLAVSFEYTINGKTLRVGDFSTGGVEAPQTLFVKLLKGTNVNPKFNLWKLMMKNIYDLNAYQVNKDGFRLDVVYQDSKTGSNLNYLPDGPLKEKILIQVMNLDNVNMQGDQQSDGLFDFIPGYTIDSERGKIIFPSVEPFGDYLEKKLAGDQSAINKYVYHALYDNTKTIAEQQAEKNKFAFMGSYQGSSNSDIPLNTINLTPGSVKVTAGGRTLVENVDYVVDYTLGRVRILNQALIESGQAISISTESEQMFSMQRKTLIGTQLNYQFTDNFNLGTTVMYLQEKPLTSKVNYGQEPISNLMLGFNGAYKTESQFLTSLVDKIPLIDTKEVSNISVEGEFAKLYPGTSNAIGESGAAYLDDFEGTQTSISLKTQYTWKLASVPQGKNDIPEGEKTNDLTSGYNRALLSWYVIDPLMQRDTPNTPSNIKGNDEEQSKNSTREVYQDEIFPNTNNAVGQPTNIPTFDLAFYPNERGQYNFDTAPTSNSSGVNADGTLKSPESRWGAIMRKIETPDFENANIEYIEFWVMDPYAELTDAEKLNSGGDLYFHLGNISEDILRDSRKSFENGLPIDGNYDAITDNTTWGRVSRNQPTVNAFDNNPSSRQYQDIGLDGLADEEERNFYNNYITEVSKIVTGASLEKIQNDPSGDNYHYFRGSDYDQQQLGILERYKYYNGVDGNSPTDAQSPESYNTSSTSLPDGEDINQDNTLSENESYFEYKISMRPNDFQVGSNFITDKRIAKVKLKNSEVREVEWYQFKIPVTKSSKTIGSISDYRSIRFIRMMMKDWQIPVVLRFATLNLVRADWRKYTVNLEDPTQVNNENTEFEVSAVNIEENYEKQPVNYVLPPGIDRVIDPANPQLRELNEQSLLLKVEDLEDGDARASYKNITTDMRMYKRLKVEVHAEQLEDMQTQDNEVRAFIRIGSDYQDNFYEYEVPLKMTPPGHYNNQLDRDRQTVWPEQNRMDILLKDLTDLKLSRNKEMRKEGSVIEMTDVFESQISYNGHPRIIRIKGNPNLGDVRIVMLGVRNPKSNDGSMESVEVWYDELRLTDVDNEGGWAASTRIRGNLADLATFSFAGSHMSSGFGGIEQSSVQRSMDDNSVYDFSSTVSFGKFFPKKWGVKIPMYYGISQNVKTPKYNPLNPDIKMTDALDALETQSLRDELNAQVQDKTVKKSINFSDVRIEPQKKSKKRHFYDVSNFSFTLSHNTTTHKDINTQQNDEKESKFLFSYNYTKRPKPVEPFRNVKALRSPMFRLIRDFNFYLSPSQLSFRSDMQSYYSAMQYRNLSQPDFKLPTSYVQDFNWYRYYNFRYDLTKSIKLDFAAQNRSRIDVPLYMEEEDRIRKEDDPYQAYKQSILDSLHTGGRNTAYNQTINASYTLPINKIPLLNWTSSTLRYQGRYDWKADPIIKDSEVNLGNTIGNGYSIQGTAGLNFVSLYNKVPYLKKVNRKFARSSSSRSRGRVKTKNVTYQDTINLKGKKKNVIKHKLNSKTLQISFKDQNGKTIRAKTKFIDNNKIAIYPSRSYKKATVDISGTVEIEDKSNNPTVVDGFTRLLMSVRNFNATYTDTRGTTMSGFLPTPKWFGNSTTGGAAPGWDFVFGWQDPDFATKAIDSGWITTDSLLNQPVLRTSNTTLNLRANIEPIKGLKISLTGNRTMSSNESEYYNYNHSEQSWNMTPANYMENGSFSMSIISIGSAFESTSGQGIPESKAYDQFMSNRAIIQQRMVEEKNPSQPERFGENQQEVLIPAFIAAYTGQDAASVELSPFPSAQYIRPNWRVEYNGLTDQIKGIKSVVRTVNISHSYRSTYSVGSYITNSNFSDTQYTLLEAQLAQQNYIPVYDISTVNIKESFSPLINVDVMWKNNISSRFEIRKTRSLTLSTSNNQLTEVHSNEYSVGLGYRIENLQIFYNKNSGQKAISNDLNMRFDMGVRENKTIIRKLAELDNQLTAGQKALTLKVTADYTLSRQLTLRMYYDRIVNTPYVSISYPTANTNFGFSIRFNLQQ